MSGLLAPPPDSALLIVLSASIGAGFSAIVNLIANYYYGVITTKRQNRVKVMDEKLSLYSCIIYHIDKMGFKADAIKKHVGDQTDTQDFIIGKEFDEIVNDLNAVIKNKYYLFKQSFFKEWVYVSTLHYDPSSKTHLIELKQTLINEYNNTIIPEYKEFTGVDIPKMT